jgi:osmotically-inducible protein OsmY
MMRRIIAAISSLALVAMLTLSVAAQQSTAEKVGKGIGSAAKKTGKAVEKGATKTADATKTAAEKTADTAKGAAKGAKEGLTAKTDPEIQKCITDKFAASRTFKDLSLGVAVTNGEVMLTGQVRNAGSKGAATSISKRCGAKKTINNIIVDTPPKPPAPKPSPTKKQ